MADIQNAGLRLRLNSAAIDWTLHLFQRTGLVATFLFSLGVAITVDAFYDRPEAKIASNDLP